MVLNAAGTGFVKASLANRTAAGRDASCIALTAADSTQPAFEPQIVGLVSAAITNLGAGTASAIRVSDTGVLARCADDDPDIVGKCDTDGVAMLDFCVNWTAIVAIAGGGSVTAPVAGIVTSDGVSLLSTTTSAGIRAQLSDETGTGSMVFATSPTLVTPNFGSATGTSAALTGYWSTGATPATAGAGRMTNDEYIYSTTSGGADARILGLSSTNVLSLGIALGQFDISILAGSGKAITSLADTYNFYAGSGLSIFGIWDSAALKIQPGNGLWIGDSDGSSNYKFAVSNLAADRNITLPLLAGNDTFVFEAHTQTLTNKTLTSPTIGGTPTISATSTQATGNARARVYSDIANVQTTDATVTSAFTWTILDEATTMVTVEACAVKSDGSVTASYIRRCRIKRDGGTVTVGTVTDVSTDEEAGFATCDITIDNSTSTGRVRVTGVAGTTIDWGVIVSRFEVSHA